MSRDMPRQKTVSDRTLLDSFEVSRGPVSTTSDIAEEVGLSLDAVRIRLRQLEEEGTVESKQVGARATVWWISSSERGQQA
jgi:predicted ArsR family transcriptional regulator